MWQIDEEKVDELTLGDLMEAFIRNLLSDE